MLDPRDEKNHDPSLLGGFPKLRGVPFGGPHHKDYNILWAILGYPPFGLPRLETPELTWSSLRASNRTAAGLKTCMTL